MIYFLSESTSYKQLFNFAAANGRFQMGGALLKQLLIHLQRGADWLHVHMDVRVCVCVRCMGRLKEINDAACNLLSTIQPQRGKE